jgi:TPR repeat protein
MIGLKAAIIEFAFDSLRCCRKVDEGMIMGRRVRNFLKASGRPQSLASCKLRHVLAIAVLAGALAATPVLAETNAGVAALTSGDYGIALKELTPPAKQGDARAEAYLASIYHYGLGVAASFSRAFYWYRAAAVQGNTDGQIGLAILYFNGQGVPKDLATAHMWLTVALDALPEGSDRERVRADRDALAQVMSAAQLQHSAKLVQNWYRNHQAP